MGKHFRSIAIVVAIFLAVIFAVDRWVLPQPSVRHLTSSEFYDAVDAGEIVSVKMVGREAAGDMHMLKGQEHFQTTLPDDRDLIPELRRKHVKYDVETQQSAPFLSMLANFIPFALMALILIFVLRQAQSGGATMSFGRSRAKLMSENRTKVTFNDVAGIEEAKQEPR